MHKCGAKWQHQLQSPCMQHLSPETYSYRSRHGGWTCSAWRYALGIGKPRQLARWAYCTNSTILNVCSTQSRSTLLGRTMGHTRS